MRANLLRTAACITVLFSGVAGAAPVPRSLHSTSGQPVLSSRFAPIIQISQLRFRDLDRNGRLTPYEDWRLSPLRRAADVAARMRFEEKAGPCCIR